jgi:hypothetical protein
MTQNENGNEPPKLTEKLRSEIEVEPIEEKRDSTKDKDRVIPIYLPFLII